MRPRPITLALCGLLLALAPARAEDPVPSGFVRVSPRDARYFETEDGKSFVPIGLNIVSPPYVQGNDPAARLAALDVWLGKLAANGGNFFRVWLSNDFYEIEKERAGQYDEGQAHHIDAMLALARKHGLRVKMTVEHFREIDPANPGKTWALNTRHHVSKGGTARSMKDWMDSPEARRQFVGKLEFFAKRYKDDPTVLGWELWNEMNAVVGTGDELAWTAAMLPELHRLFPRQLAMQSFGSFDTDGVRESYRKMVLLPGNDLAQVHRYLDLGARLEVCHGPVDVLASAAVHELLAIQPGKPVLLAESGAVEPSHSGPFKQYAKDREGIILHDVLFAPFFSGAAGTGQCWHWDRYVDANDLWWQFGRFAAATKGIDPPAEAFEAVTVEHPAVRVYLLKGKHTWLAWCRDKGSDWRTELAEGKKPERLEGVVLNLPGADGLGSAARCRVYDPWADRWTEAKLHEGRIGLPPFTRSIVVRIER